MKKLNFTALAKVMEKIDDNGRSGRCGNWYMGLGGYDMGYEIYYKNEPIGRVNYEFGEYELYDEDFIPKEQIPEFLAAIDARKFKDVGEHEEELEDEGEEMVSEGKKKIMWAINFRNMHTAVHGLFYGKDKKRVEEFANEIEYIENNADWDWDEKQYAWESLYEDYPDIATMDEFNHRDIVDLPGGYEGIEDGDTIYRFVNRVSMDIYNEKTMTDWETGEKDYDDEQQFKADQQFFSDKDKSEKEMLSGKTSKKIVKENTKFPFMANGRNFLKLIDDLGDENVVGVKNVRGDDNTSFILFDDDYSIKDAKEFAELLEQRYDNISVQVEMGRNYGNSTPMVVVNKKKMLKEADGMGMSYDELMARFLEIQEKLGKKS